MAAKNKKVIFIICYFGDFPWFFKFFLKSAGCNGTIDFLLVTDNADHGSLPANFKVLPMALVELQALARQKLGITVTLNYAYKVCDIRPAYGLIFNDYVRCYDFWGYCDADVIFGDIRTFIPKRILNKYDVISARPDFLPGYFALYKNIQIINELFMRSKDYLMVFADQKYHNFDECNVKHVEVVDGQSMRDLDFEIESMTYLLKEKCHKEGVRSLFDLMALDFIPGKMSWNNGVLIYNDQYQILLFHLLQYKRENNCLKPDWATVPDEFFINQYSFSLSPEPIAVPPEVSIV